MDICAQMLNSEIWI